MSHYLTYARRNLSRQPGVHLMASPSPVPRGMPGEQLSNNGLFGNPDGKERWPCRWAIRFAPARPARLPKGPPQRMISCKPATRGSLGSTALQGLRVFGVRCYPFPEIQSHLVLP